MSTPLIFGLGLALVVMAAFGLIALSRGPSAQPAPTPRPKRHTPSKSQPKSQLEGELESELESEIAGFGAEPTAVIHRERIDGNQTPTQHRSERPTGPHRIVTIGATSDNDKNLAAGLQFEVRVDLEVDSPRETACLKALLRLPEDPEPALELSGLLQQRGHPQGDAIIAQWARLSATTDEEFHHAAWAESEVMGRVAATLVETVDPWDPALSMVWRQGFIQHAQIGCGDVPINDDHAMAIFARLVRSPAALLMTDLVIKLDRITAANDLVVHTLPPGLRRLSVVCGDQEAWGRIRPGSPMVHARWAALHAHAASPGFDGEALVAACATDNADVLAIDLRRAAIACKAAHGSTTPCFRVAGERATELFQLGAPPAAQLDGILAALGPIGCRSLNQLTHVEPHYTTQPIEAAAHRVIAAGGRASLVQQLLAGGALLVTRDIPFGPGRCGGFLAIFEERALFVSPRILPT